MSIKIALVGNPNTGKTTLLKYFAQHTAQNVVVLATTGLAAINVHGQTVHSFFRLKPGNLLDRSLLRKLPRNIVESFDTLIVDEASMLRADLLDAMDHILKISTCSSLSSSFSNASLTASFTLLTSSGKELGRCPKCEPAL